MANENNYTLRGLGSGQVEVPTNIQLLDKDQVTVLLSVDRTTGVITGPGFVGPIGGVSITGIPTVGQVPTATSGSAATWQSPASSTPAGSNTQVQFNSSGSFGASSKLTFDGNALGSNFACLGNTSYDGNSVLRIGPALSGPTMGRTILEMDNGTGLFQIETSGGATQISTGDVTTDLKLSANDINGLLLKNGTGLVIVQGRMQFNDNATGSGSAALGTNCPAVTPTAPYTWIKIQSSDGSVVYVPAYK